MDIDIKDRICARTAAGRSCHYCHKTYQFPIVTPRNSSRRSIRIAFGTEPSERRSFTATMRTLHYCRPHRARVLACRTIFIMCKDASLLVHDFKDRQFPRSGVGNASITVHPRFSLKGASSRHAFPMAQQDFFTMHAARLRTQWRQLHKLDLPGSRIT